MNYLGSYCRYSQFTTIINCFYDLSTLKAMAWSSNLGNETDGKAKYIFRFVAMDIQVSRQICIYESWRVRYS